MNASIEAGYGSERCGKRTKDQCRILAALMNSSTLSLTELSNRTGLTFRIIQRELVGLVSCHIVLKDEHKLYSLDPAYGKFLIDEGLAVLGYQKPPDKVRFVTIIQKLKGVLDELMLCLKRACIIILGTCGWLLRTFHGYATILILMPLMRLK